MKTKIVKWSRVEIILDKGRGDAQFIIKLFLPEIKNPSNNKLEGF